MNHQNKNGGTEGETPMFSGLSLRTATLRLVQSQALAVSKDETRPEMVGNIFDTTRGPETLPRTTISLREVS